SGEELEITIWRHALPVCPLTFPSEAMPLAQILPNNVLPALRELCFRAFKDRNGQAKSKKIVAERLGTTKNQEPVGEGVFRPGSPLRKSRGFTTAQSAPFANALLDSYLFPADNA